VLLLTGGNGFVSLAERHVPAGLAALVVASVPLWLLLIRTVAGDRPVRATLVGLAVGFLGVGLLVVRGGHDQCVSIPHLLIVLGASLSWALGSWASSRLPMPSDAATGTAVEMLIGGVVLGALGRSRDPGGVRPDSGLGQGRGRRWPQERRARLLIGDAHHRDAVDAVGGHHAGDIAQRGVGLV
jgi:drug/metabolite transporter (DMT)-like permease